MPTHSRFMVCQKVLRNRCSAEADQGAGQGSMESPPPPLYGHPLGLSVETGSWGIKTR